MPKYVYVVAHLGLDELGRRYRQADDPIERSHFQIIWRLSCGKRVREGAEVTGYCATWIRILARCSNHAGPEMLTAQRQHNHGASSLLTGDHQQQFQHVPAQAPPDGGLWTGPKGAMWMGEQLGCKIHPQRGWDALKHLGFSLQNPRPHHHKADATKPRSLEARAAGADPTGATRLS